MKNDDAELDEMRAALLKKRAEAKQPAMLSTGCTLLNKACSGRVFSAFPMGGFYLVVGDSTAGKTAVAGTCFAEACLDPKFDGYDLIFDNIENGALMFEKFFGAKIAERIKPPYYNADGSPGFSRTVEEFYYNLHNATHKLRDGKRVPVIYVADSENSMGSDAEKKKFKKQKNAFDKEEETAGSMSDSHAKVHSQNLRGACVDLRDTNSILIMTSQTRDNLGFGAMFNPKTRSGGRAMKFYAMWEIWLSVRKNLTKTVNDKPRIIGHIITAQVKKNRFTGKERTVTFPIYDSVGIDDLGGCVDYLVEEGHWKSVDGTISAPELRVTLKREKLIAYIEEHERADDVRKLVGKVWDEIELACVVTRKSRYLDT